MNTQTPEEVAAATLAAAGYADWYRPYQEQVLELIAEAVNADRAARAAALAEHGDDGDPIIAANAAHAAALTHAARAREALGEARRRGLPTHKLQTALQLAELEVRATKRVYAQVAAAVREDLS